nr:tyrosine kinase [Hymenolepis microstoma]
MDNQPCLMYLDSEVGEQDSPGTLDSRHSSLKPTSRTLPERKVSSLDVFDAEQNKRVQLDSAFMLFSARQLIHPKQHCAFITSLICAGSFRQSDAVAALQNYRPTSDTKSFPQGDGWKELLALNTNISYFFPENGCAGLPLSTATDKSRRNNQNPSSENNICHKIDFKDLMESTTSNDSTSDCYTGRGIDYRGTAAGPPSCLPWSELDYVISNFTQDPLTYISKSLLPAEAFDPLPTNYSVCRNPLGLGAAPFCIGFNLHSGRLETIDCPMFDCLNVDSSTFTPYYAEVLRRRRANMISIITTMTAFFLIILCILFAYILRICHREKVHASIEDAGESRRAHLVARRIRLREAGCCARCLLRCLFILEDACCCVEVSKFGAGRTGQGLTKVSLKGI